MSRSIFRNALVIGAFLACAPAMVSAQSGGSFSVTQSVIGNGGGAASGGAFTTNGTSGQAAAGANASGGSFVVSNGFWAAIPLSTAPVVGTTTSSSVTASSATLGGTVVSDGGSVITERGLVYAVTSTNNDPLIGGTGVVKVIVAGTTGVFTTGVSSLAASTGYSFKAYAINAVGTTYTTPVATFTTSAPLCPTITLGALANGLVGTAYSGSSAASGGTGPYAYAVTSGILPSSVSLTLSGAGAGNVAGTPAATGTYNFQITATDTSAPGTCTGARNYTVYIGSTVAASDLVIREFRLRGPASTTDEYVVIHNRTTAPLTVASTDGSSGFAVASSDNNVVFTIPNGTVIPARGHFLGVNTAGYSLGGAADASWTADIAEGLGLGLFRTATPANFGAPSAIDAVGVGSSSAPYLEGTALASLITPGEYAWVRKALNDVVQDTGANSADFLLVSTNGGLYDSVQSVLGAPAPTRSVLRDVYSGMGVSLIEPNLSVNLNPNRLRVLAGGDRLEFRRRITNNTGATVTALRLRFNEVTTFNSPGYSPGTTQADLRPGTSATAAINLTSIGATSVTGLTLVTPPAQAMGGGLNSILTIPGGLAPGAFVDINIALYVTRAGSYRFFATIEAQ